MKWNKKVKAQKWAEMIKENIAYVHDRELTNKANLLVLGVASVLFMLIVFILLARG